MVLEVTLLRKYVFFVILVAGALSAWGQKVDTVDDVKVVTSAFLDFAVSGEFNQAFDYIGARPTGISEDDMADLEVQVIQQLTAIEDLYGRTVDYRLIEENLVSDFVLRLIYVVRYENYIIRWRFLYYNPRGTWKLVSLFFDDQLEDLFH